MGTWCEEQGEGRGWKITQETLGERILAEGWPGDQTSSGGRRVRSPIRFRGDRIWRNGGGGVARLV